MPKMKVTISPDKENRTAKAIMHTLILLAKEKVASCQLTSPTEATIEGDQDTLLEILEQIDNAKSARTIGDFVISMDFDKSESENITQRDIDALKSELGKELSLQPFIKKTKKDKKRLHNMVLERLARHIKK